MSRSLKKAGSLFNIICRNKSEDCVQLFHHLNDQGIELICKLLFVIIGGHLEVHPNSHDKLKKKIKKQVNEVKKLFLIPRNSKDILKKRQILQKKGIISTLTAIAKAIIPIINKETVAKKAKKNVQKNRN